jgi:hypothetical protein
MPPCGTGLKLFVVLPALNRRLFVPPKNSWRLNVMARDPIVDEVRRFRDIYAEQFHYDLEAICRDIRAKQTQSGRQVVCLPPKPVQTTLVSKEK